MQKNGNQIDKEKRKTLAIAKRKKMRLLQFDECTRETRGTTCRRVRRGLEK